MSGASSFWEHVLLQDQAIGAERRASILSWITTGVSIKEFMRPFHGTVGSKRIDSDTPLPFQKANAPMEDPTFAEFAGEEIGRMLRVGAVKRCETGEVPVCVMPISVIQQKSKKRLILDGRWLNLWMDPDPVKYDDLRSFARGLQRKDWLCSVDFKSGYHHVPLAKEDYKYFGFEWGGEYFEYVVLPFGFSPAPTIFQTLSGVLALLLRRKGFHSLVYLDDLSFRLPRKWTGARRATAVWLIAAVIYLAGFTLAIAKSHLLPVRSLVLLGIGLDTVRECFWVPDEKFARLMELVGAFRAGKTVTVWEAQSLAGKVQSIALAVPPVAIFLRSLYDEVAKAEAAGQNLLVVSAVMEADLAELGKLKSWERLSAWVSETHATFTLETDASGIRWGGAPLFYRGESHMVGAPFTKEEMPLHIHVKELLAVKYSLHALGHLTRRCILDIFTDNVIVQHTLLDGKALDPVMRAFARELLQFQLSSGVRVRVYRIPTKKNVSSDTISRVELPKEVYDRNDHRLNPTLFALLQDDCGQEFTVDACAGPKNAQVARYISRYPVTEPGCIAVDVFTFHFPRQPYIGPEFIYANPPWPIIGALWQHFKECRARGVMVVPHTPQKQWYFDVINNGTAVRRLAKKGELNVFFQPSLGYAKSVGPVPWDVLAVSFDFSAQAMVCLACLKPSEGPVFCGNCGTKLPMATPPKTEASLWENFQQRIGALAGLTAHMGEAATRVARDLLHFMHARLGMTNPVIAQADPNMIAMFLIAKDERGSTIVHNSSCPSVGCDKITPECGPACVARASAKGVTTTYGTLRGVFNKAGMTQPWDEETGRGNPCISTVVERCIKGTHIEQLAAGCTTRQSALMGLTTYEKLQDNVRAAWSVALSNCDLLAVAQAAQDFLYYAVMWETGLRPADAGRLWAQHLSRRAQGDWSWLVGETKTAKKVTKDRRVLISAAPYEFGVPIAVLMYEKALRGIGLPTPTGLMFPSLKFDKRTGTGSAGGPVAFASMLKRFIKHLHRAGLPTVLTLHSFHGSCAARDRAEGKSIEFTCERMDWTPAMYHYYLDGRDVLPTGDAAQGMTPEEMGLQW